jgi:hypothetical protein
MDKIWEWRHHSVYGDNDWVVKIPKKTTPITWRQAKNSLNFFEENFPEFIPETHLEKWWKEIPYFVTQKRVHGVLLAEHFALMSLSPDIWEKLREFTERAYTIILNDGRWFDIIGTPTNPIHKWNWEWCTNFITNPESGSIHFIDTIAWSSSLSLPSMLCKIGLIIAPSYRKRKELTYKLLWEIPS